MGDLALDDLVVRDRMERRDVRPSVETVGGISLGMRQLLFEQLRCFDAMSPIIDRSRVRVAGSIFSGIWR